LPAAAEWERPGTLNFLALHQSGSLFGRELGREPDAEARVAPGRGAGRRWRWPAGFAHRWNTRLMNAGETNAALAAPGAGPGSTSRSSDQRTDTVDRLSCERRRSGARGKKAVAGLIFGIRDWLLKGSKPRLVCCRIPADRRDVQALPTPTDLMGRLCDVPRADGNPTTRYGAIIRWWPA